MHRETWFESADGTSFKHLNLFIRKAIMKKFKQFDVLVSDTIEKVLAQIGSQTILVTSVKGDVVSVKGNSLRLRTFKETGVMCPLCEAQATHWVLTYTSEDKAHLNLMGPDGLLFTHDHVTPLNQGGQDNLANSHTMCFDCNYFLGDKSHFYGEASQNIKLLLETTRVVYNSENQAWRVSVNKMGHTARRPKRLYSDFYSFGEAFKFAKDLVDNPRIDEFIGPVMLRPEHTLRVTALEDWLKNNSI